MVMFSFQNAFVFPGTIRDLNFLISLFCIYGYILSYTSRNILNAFGYFFSSNTSNHLSVPLVFLLENPWFGGRKQQACFLCGFCTLLFCLLFPFPLFPGSPAFSFFLVCFILLKCILSSFLRRVAWEVNYFRPCMSGDVYTILVLLGDLTEFTYQTEKNAYIFATFGGIFHSYLALRVSDEKSKGILMLFFLVF